MSTVLTNNFTELATGATVGAKYLVHGSAKAWANLNGTGTIALRASFGVSSVVDEGTGQYRYNWSNAFATGNYTTPSSPGGSAVSMSGSTSRPAGSVSLVTYNASGTAVDAVHADVAAFGDLA